MIRWEQLDSAPVPGGGGDLRLMRRGDEFSIMAGRIELMNSRVRGSEEALAALACERLGGAASPDVLIGGLGMGFTLRAALDVLGPGARVTVAELVPQVVEWARGPLAALFGDSLADARVRIRLGDVGEAIAEQPDALDAILLDVDNGPEGLIRSANDALYAARGLAAAARALRPGGGLAIWSCAPAAGFTQRLRAAGFGVTETRVRANGLRGARHVIWIAIAPAQG